MHLRSCISLRSGCLRVLVILLVVGTSAVKAAQPQKFLTFDRDLTPAWVKAHPNQYVFVWGADNAALTEAFVKYSPGTLLSSYYPYSRDPDSHHDARFWLTNHPDWVAYTCGKRTPVTMYGSPHIGLDITNPKVIAWQIANFMKRPAGVQAVALDNFQFRNDGHTCGGLSSKGRFDTNYSGKPQDPVYAEDVVRWLQKVSVALHAHGVKVIVNHIPDLSADGDDPDSPLVKDMVKSVDGIVDEYAQYALDNSRQADLLARFVSYVGAENKWFYLIYHLKAVNEDKVESSVANYLMMAGPKTAIYISDGDSTYGKEPNFMGFDRNIGDPCAGPVTQNGIMSRKYSRGLAIFAAANQSSVAFHVPPGYQQTNGDNAGGTIHLTGGHGRVLYATDNIGCGK